MEYRYRTRKPKKDLKKVNRILLLAILVIVAAWLIYIIISRTELSPIVFIPGLSTSGYMEVDVNAGIVDNSGIVVLKGGCYELVASTETYRAESIANGLQGKVGIRPDTHDLMRDALDNLEISVVMVKIVSIENGTFYGRLILRQDNRVADLDSRPSDGIALAVRTGAPIYIKEDLMKTEGKNIC